MATRARRRKINQRRLASIVLLAATVENRLSGFICVGDTAHAVYGVWPMISSEATFRGRSASANRDCTW
jgi:hypothetical protein